MCIRLNILWFVLVFWLCLSAVLQAEDQEPAGKMLPLLQNSESSLKSYEAKLNTWDILQGALRTELTALRTELTTAQNGLETALADSNQSKILSTQLMNTSEASLRRIDSLESYNLQIAQRMQERDEDLAQAYSTIDKQEKKILKMIITIITLSFTLIILTAILILMIYGKIKFNFGILRQNKV